MDAVLYTHNNMLAYTTAALKYNSVYTCNAAHMYDMDGCV